MESEEASFAVPYSNIATRSAFGTGIGAAKAWFPRNVNYKYTLSGLLFFSSMVNSPTDHIPIP